MDRSLKRARIVLMRLKEMLEFRKGHERPAYEGSDTKIIVINAKEAWGELRRINEALAAIDEAGKLDSPRVHH